jgi:ABC-type amino acid transport substrate-binding protein
MVRRLSSLFAVLAFGASLNCAASLAQSTTIDGDPSTVIVVVHRNFPPQFIVKDGEPDGLAVEFFAEVAAVIGVTPRYVFANSWTEGMDIMRSGRADIFPNVGITDKRRSFLEFSEPDEAFHISLVVRADSTDIDGIESLRGRVLGVQETNFLTKKFAADRH